MSSIKPFLSLAAVMLIGAGTAHATCNYPEPPRGLPDGNTATKEEMLKAHKVVQEFEKKVDDYAACIKGEFDKAMADEGSKMNDQQKEELKRKQSDKYSAARAELEAIAKHFNEQARLFNARTATTAADEAKKN